MTFFTLAILFLLPIMGVGMWLLIRGLRGSIVGDHPYCTACGFDLFGRPPESYNCSECGRDLRQIHSIRIGRRVRRPRLIALGLALFLPADLLLTVLAFNLAGGFDPTSFKPLWWLASDAFGTNSIVQQTALKEIGSRLASNKLSANQVNPLADRILLRQADLSKPWLPAWGDLLEQVQSAGLLSQDRWDRFHQVRPTLGFRVRPRVRLGDPIPYWIDYGPTRIGTRTQLYAVTQRSQVRIGSLVLKEIGGGGTSLNSSGGGAIGFLITPARYAGQLQPGPQRFTFTGTWSIRKSWQNSDPLLAEFEIPLSADFTLQPADQPTVTLRNDPALRPAVEAAISASVQYRSESAPSRSLSVNISVNNVPIGIGYEVIARAGDQQWPISTFACPASTNGHSWGMSATVKDFTSDYVDLILKPSPAAAAASINTFEIWSGQVILQHIKVDKK